MNCTELIVHSSRMIEIHTMKFNYEIHYKENYKQNVHHSSEEHYTGRFLVKEHHTHQINQVTGGKTHKVIPIKTHKVYSH